MAVSIFDVAKEAGVSSATVSHSINGKRYVSPELRARVEAAMQKLQYIPSRAARNLALGQTNIIGLLVPDVSNGFFAELAKGVEQAAIAQGYNVILGNTGWNKERELFYFEMVRSRAVDGLIYAAGAHTTGVDIRSVIGELPLVLVDEEVEGLPACSVVSDNREGGRLAAEHLYSLGHRNCLVIGGAEELASSVQRIDGFVDAWRALGAPEPVIEHATYTESGGAQVAERYADACAAGDLTAVFAANDLLAVGLIASLEARGISSPRDVSVVGFDDSPVAQWVRPGLTTVRQPTMQLGQRAAELLLAALISKTPLSETREVLGVELVVRATTGPR